MDSFMAFSTENSQMLAFGLISTVSVKHVVSMIGWISFFASVAYHVVESQSL